MTIEKKKLIGKYTLEEVVAALLEALRPTAGHSPVGPVTVEPAGTVVTKPPVVPIPPGERERISASELMAGQGLPWSQWRSATAQAVSEAFDNGTADTTYFYRDAE